MTSHNHHNSRPESSSDPDIHGKRPHSLGDQQQQQQQNGSPSNSPSHKKIHQSPSQNQGNQVPKASQHSDFYPEYMKNSVTGLPPSGNGGVQPSYPNTQQSSATAAGIGVQGQQTSQFQYFQQENGANSTRHMQMLPTFPSDHRVMIPPSPGLQGNGNFLVLSNSQGLPLNSVNLEDVMTRVMSGVMSKLDSMSADLKQVAINKEATIQLRHDLVQVKQDYSGMSESIKILQQREDESAYNQRGINQELRAIKEKLEKPPDTGNQQNTHKSDMELLKLKADQLKNNLIIEGLPEFELESETDQVPDDEALKKVETFFEKTLNLTNLDIDSAYRLGKLRQGAKYPRSILVKFIRPRDREAVWRARPVLTQDKDNKVRIKEDLPQELRTQLSALLRVAQVAKRYPDTYKNVSVNDFKIQVNGTSYTADQLENLPRKLRPSEYSTPGNADAVVFYGRDSRFSNHYQSNFVWDRKSFATMEQYLAYRRSHIAGRKDLANKAMGSNDPAVSKRIMNELRAAPTEKEWIESRRDILYSGLMAKFSQREDLMKYLLESENRQLGEASRDTTWGIGMTLLDRMVLSPNHWRGANLLGTTLMDVRKELSSLVQNNPQAQKGGKPDDTAK